MDARLLVLLSLIVGSLAGPINYKVQSFNRDSCARHCRDTKNFFYRTGTNYEFDYDVDSRTTIDGSFEDNARLRLRATAHIGVLSPCEYSLTLRNVQLYESDPNNPSRMINADSNGEFRRALERHGLRFAFHDGAVEEVCITHEEPKWILNIKRGVLSTFQNRMEDLQSDQRLHEVDVTGRCDAEYTRGSSSWNSVHIEKKKDLLGCTDRHGYRSALQGTPYRVPSTIQSLPLLKSTHTSEQDISKTGQLQNAIVREMHVFRPFANGPNGAMTETTQKLRFTRETNRVARQEPIERRSDLLFEHENGNSEEDRQNEIKKLLENMCSTNGVHMETPGQFAELVYRMKETNENSMRDIYKDIKQGRICQKNPKQIRKFFMDALPMVGTRSSLALMKDFLLDKEVQGVEADMWLTSLAFIQNPTRDMLSVLKSLFKLSPTGMLSVSSLINNFCQIQNCENDRDIRDMVQSLTQKYGRSCDVNDKNYENILMVLRSLGNIGHIRGALDFVNDCITKRENPMQIRVSAIESLRRLPCSYPTDNKVIELFRNKDEDSELRINSYLAMMRCPDKNTINIIRRTLEHEEVNQLGSFVWSHLTNLMETSSPHQQSIRLILNDERLKKEFNLDNRKFSRNYEGSFFFERFNTGAKLDSNLIWSSKSFMPRSAMVNMTLELFGHSINFLEVGGRIEGLEYLLESYFGPNGYFGEDTHKPMNKKAINNLQENKLNKMDQEFNAKKEQLRGGAYLRVFGNELRYKNINGLKSIFDAQSFNFIDFMMKLSKDQKYTFSHNEMFLDSSMIIPTSAGLPLNLTVNGTATIEIDMSGKLNIGKLFTSARTLDIDGYIRPSGAIEIASLMSVDAFFTKTGLKMTTTLNTNTLVKGHIKLSNGQILSAEFDMPEKKAEIFGLRTTYFTLHNKAEREQKMITENSEHKKICTGEKVADVSGLELCAELRYPNASMKHDAPYFPLTGPLCFGITLDKKDTHTGYKLMAKAIKDKQDYVVDFSVDTPKSTRKSRSIGFETRLKPKDKSVELSMHSPWKSLEFGGHFNYTQALKRVYGKMTIDKDQVYDITAETKLTRNKAYRKYDSKFEMNIPKHKKISIVHSINLKAKKIETELTATGVPHEPWIVEATASNTDKEKGIMGSMKYNEKKIYSLEARMTQSMGNKKKVLYSYQPIFRIRVPDDKEKNGRVLVSAGGTFKYVPDASINIDFSIEKLTKAPISFKALLKQAYYARKNRRYYNGRVDIQTPIMKVSTYGRVDNRNFKSIIYRITTDYNARFIRRNKVVLNGKWLNKSIIRKGVIRAMRGNWNNILTMSAFPQYNTDVNVKVNHNKKYSEFISRLTYGDKPKQTANLNVKSKHVINKKVGTNLNIDAQLTHTNKDINVHIKGSHKLHGDSLNSNLKIQLAKNKVVSGSIVHSNNEKKKAKSTSVNIQYPGGVIDIKNTLIKDGNQYREKLNILLPKFGRNRMDGTFTKAGDKEYQASANVYLAQYKPINLDGNIKIDMNDFKSGLTVKYGKAQYGMKAKTKINPQKSIMSEIFISSPWRDVKAKVNGQKKGQYYIGDTSLLWGDESDKSKQITASIDLVHKGYQKINTSLSLHYPGRTLNLKLENSLKPKLQTHCEIAWSPTKKAILDLEISDKDAKRHRVIDGNLKFQSPFTVINGEFNLRNNDKEYSNVLKVSWDKEKTIVNKISLKKPYSLSHVRGIWKTTTPFSRFGKFHLEVNHNLDDKLHSSASVAVNNEEVEIGIDGEIGKKSGRDYTGEIQFKSTFQPIRGFQLKGKHKNDGKIFKNNMALKLNGKNYAYDLSMKHNLTGWNLHNTGDLKIRTPGRAYKTEWNHVNKNDQIHTTFLHGTKKKNFVDLTLHGNHVLSNTRKLSASVILKTPVKSISNVNMKMEHEIAANSIESSTTIKNEGRKIIYIDGKVAKSIKGLDADLTFYTPLTNDEFNVKLDANVRYNKYPMTYHAGLLWAKGKSASVDGSLNIDSKQLDGSFRVVSPMDFARSLLLEVNNKYDNQRCITKIRFERQPGNSHTETSSFEMTHSVNSPRFLDVTLSTPYSQLELVKINYNIKGNLRRMMTTVSAEVKPYLDNIKMNAAWNTESEMSGSLNLVTPFEALPKFNIFGNIEKNNQGHTLNARVEYHPSKEITLTATGNLKNRKDLNAEIDLRTPFKPVKYVKATFKHLGTLKRFNTNVGLKVNQNRNTDISISLNAHDGIHTTISSNSPYYKNILAEISYQRANNEITANSVITYGRMDLINTKLRLGSLPSYNGEFELQTQAIKIENIKVSFEHEAKSLREVKSMFELMYGKSKMSVRINRSKNIDASIVISSPYEQLRQFDFNLNHDGDMSNFNNKISAIYNGHEIRSDIIANLRKPLTLNLALQTPFQAVRHLQLTLNHEGELNNFKTHAEYALNYRNSVGDIEFSLEPHITGKFSVSMPYSIRNIQAELNHRGSIHDFNNYAFINVDGKEVRVETNFRHQPDVDGRLHITTPFEKIRSVEVNIGHKGILKDFTCHGEVILNNKKYGGSIESKIKGSIYTQIEIITPADKHSAVVHLTGTTENFNFESEVNLSKLTGKLALTKNDAIQLNMNLKAGSEWQMQLDFTQKGTLDDFETNLSGDINRQAFGTNIKFVKEGNGFTANAKLYTPIEQIENIQVDVTHREKRSGFKTSLNGNLNGEKCVANVEFKDINNIITFTSNVETPFSLLHNMNIELRLTRETGKLENVLNMDINGITLVNELSINKDENTLGFILNVNHPIHRIKYMEIKLNHRGKSNNLKTTITYALWDIFSGDLTLESTHTNFEITTNLKTKRDVLKNIQLSIRNSRNPTQYSGEITTNLDTSVLRGDATFRATFNRAEENKRTIHMQTNFENMRKIQFDLTHTGIADNFDTMLSGQFGDQKIDGNLLYKVTGDSLNMVASINTPCKAFETIKFEISETGHSKDFEAKINGNLNKYFANCNFKFGQDMVVSANLRCPHSEPFDLHFEKKGTVEDLKTKGSIKYGPRTGSFDVTFTMSPTIQGNMIVKLPVEKYAKTVFSFDISPEEKALRFQSKLQYGNNKEIQLIGGYDATDGHTGSITLQSPFCSDINLSWKLSGSKKNFRIALEGKYGEIKYSGEAAFKNEDELSGELTLNSLDVQVIHIQFSQEGTIKQFSTNFELTVLEYKTEGDLKVNFPEEIVGKITSNSPLGNYEFEYNHHSTSDDSTCHLEAMVNEEKYEADLVIKLQQRTEGSLTIKTPIDEYKETVLSFNMDGSWRNFNSDMNVMFKNENAKLSTQFAIGNGILNLDLSLTTPFESIKSLHIETQNALKKEESVSSHVKVTYNSEELLESSFSLDWTKDLSLNIEISTPLERFEKNNVKVVLSKNVNIYKADIDLEVMKKKITASVTFDNKRKNRAGTLTLKTPVEGYENIIAKFSNKITENTLTCNAQIHANDEELLFIEYDHTKSVNSFENSVTFRSPYMEPIKLRITHDGKKERVSTITQLDFGSEAVLKNDLSFILTNQFTDINNKFTATIAGEKTSMQGTITHKRKINGASTQLLASYNDKIINIQNEWSAGNRKYGKLEVSTPFDHLSSANIEFEQQQHSNHLTLSYNCVKHNFLAKLESPRDMPLLNMKFSLKLTDRTDSRNNVQTRWNHNIAENGWSINGDAVYKGKPFSISSDGRITPSVDVSFTVRTPFSGFEETSTKFSFENGEKSWKAESNIYYGDRKSITFKSYAKCQTSPMQFNVHVTTPFSEWKTFDLEAEYLGKIHNHESSLKIQRSNTVPFVLTTKLAYTSPLAMDGSVLLTSGLQGFEKLSLKVQNEDMGNKYTSYIEAGLNEDKIVFEGQCEPHQTYDKHTLKTEVKVKTPFSVLEGFAFKTEYDLGTEEKTGKVYVEYNGKGVFDVYGQYQKSSTHNIMLVLRQPHPMRVQVNGVVSKRMIDGDVMLDWDSNNPDSNIRIETRIKQRQLMMKLVKDGRIMGLESSMRRTQYSAEYSGKLILNENTGSVIGYETQSITRGNTRRNDLKILTPWRILSMDNTVQRKRDQNIVNGQLSWNTEQPDKHIGWKLTVNKGTPNKKVGLELQLPSIGKDIKLETEFTVFNDMTIIDSSTELTYSKYADSLKIFSRVMDISPHGHNYSFAFGIKHPATAVDLEVSGTVGKTNERLTGSMNIDYITAMKRRKNIALIGEIDRVKKQINLELNSPIKKLQISGKVKTEAPYQISYRAVEDDSRVSSGMASYDPNTRSITMKTHYDPSNFRKVLEWNASLGSQKIDSEIALSDGRDRTIESLIALTLNTSHILHSRFEWNPHMIEELKEYGSHVIDRNGKKIEKLAKIIAQGLTEEVEERYNLMSQHVYEELRPIFDLIHEMLSELRNFEKAFVKAYYENKYYLRNVIDESLLEQPLILYNNLKQMVLVAEWVSNVLNENRQTIADGIRKQMVEAEWKMARTIQHLTMKSAHRYKKLMDLLKTEYEQWIVKSREQYNRIREVVKKIEEKLNADPSVVNIKEHVNRFINNIPSVQQMIPEQYAGMIYNASGVMSDRIDTVMKKPGIRHIRDVSNRVYQQGKWAWNYWRVKENLIELLNDFTEELQNIINQEIRTLKKTILFDMNRSRVIAFNPENGHIQIELYSPLPVRSLNSLPRIDLRSKINAIKSMIPKVSRFSLWDIYYKYIPPRTFRELIPPFKALAAISDSSHFFTFDGRHFDFAGRCSYVLVRDMLHNNFTVIANYNRRSKIDSIQILTIHNVIEIRENGRIRVDNRRVELPNKSGNATMERVGDVIRIREGNNFVLDYDMAHDYYFIAIDGWYHGRLAGMLGYYDNEPFNDMMMSNGIVTDNIADFASSWEVANRCGTQKNFAEYEVRASEETKEKCRRFFWKNNSTFRPCFSQVKPEEFMHVCEKEMTRGRHFLCKTAAIYVHMCKEKRVHLKLPKQCVRCRNPDGKYFIEGENITLSTSRPRQADVLFVLESNSCNKKTFKKLDNLAKDISQQMKKEGIADTKFGLMGYNNYEVHMHTVNGDIFTDAKTFTPESEELKDENKADAMMALKKAAQYPYRAGSKRIVILIPCGMCQEHNIRYKDIHHLYKTQDISMHLLKPMNFDTKKDTSTPRTHYIFGLDDKKAYSVIHKQGDEKLLNELHFNKDKCVDLAKATDGSAFDKVKLNQGRQSAQKDFSDIFVKRIAQSGKPSECQTCKCVSNEQGMGISVCHKCSRMNEINDDQVESEAADMNEFSEYLNMETRQQ